MTRSRQGLQVVAGKELELPSVEPGLGRVSDVEIIRQIAEQNRDTQNRILSELSSMRQDRKPPPPPPPPTAVSKWLPTINVLLGVLLAATIAGVGTVYSSSTTKLDNAVAENRILRLDFEALQKDRMQRIATFDARLDVLEGQDRIYRVALSDFRRLEGEVREGFKQFGSRLDSGKEERLRDTEKLRDKMNELDRALALLSQRFERRPFGERQSWQPWPLREPLLVRVVDYAVSRDHR